MNNLFSNEIEPFYEEGTITRRMGKILFDLEDEFKSLIGYDDFIRVIHILENADNNEDKNKIRNKLYYMLDIADIDCKTGQDSSYYYSIIRKAKLLSFEDILKTVTISLMDRYKEFPKPTEYLKRIVDNNSFLEDSAWKDDSLRLRILKQFIKYGNYLSDAGYGGKQVIKSYVEKKIGHKPTKFEILECLDDKVFENQEYLNAKKEQRKAKGKYGLLKAVDDLACVKFKGGGSTKKLLYLFAIVYDMTFYIDNKDKNIEKDIEKNMFEDFYSNNLMRFLEVPNNGINNQYEIEPPGYGINYKNFAEIVYLYYLSKNLSPLEKIIKSSRMIKALKTEGEIPKLHNKDINTQLFRNYIFVEDILRKSEDEFYEFVRLHYKIDVYDEIEKRSMGAFELERNQNTAFNEYKKLLNKIKDNGLELEDCKYGLQFIDSSDKKENLINIIKQYKPTEDIKIINEFVDLLMGINSYLGGVVGENLNSTISNHQDDERSIARTKALFIENPKDITRTSIIVAYYYLFNLIHESPENDWSEWTGFKSVYDAFKGNVDKILDRCHYSRINGKNIFDIVVIFSAYSYMSC